MTDVAVSLDHVGIGVIDLDRAAAQYMALGFSLTPLARHGGAVEPGGPVREIGTANRCAMLGGGYIELIAVVDDSAPDYGLGARIARYEGVHIMALATSDPGAVADHLKAAGIAADGPLYLERGADLGGTTGTARFERVVFPADAVPEGRIFYIDQLTPELLWHPAYLDHPNGARAVRSITFAVPDAKASAGRLERIASVATGSLPAHAADAIVTVLERSAAEERFGPLATGEGPQIVALTVSVADLSRAKSVLAANGVKYAAAEGGIEVDPAFCAGVHLSFVAEDRG